MSMNLGFEVCESFEILCAKNYRIYCGHVMRIRYGW